MTYSAKRLTQQLATVVMLLGCAHVSAQDFAALPTSASKHGDTQEKVELGKKLYFDPRLSATGTVSCNSCHNLMEGGDDGRATSMGVDGLTGPRNAPTVWNSAFPGLSVLGRPIGNPRRASKRSDGGRC